MSNNKPLFFCIIQNIVLYEGLNARNTLYSFIFKHVYIASSSLANRNGIKPQVKNYKVQIRMIFFR